LIAYRDHFIHFDNTVMCFFSIINLCLTLENKFSRTYIGFLNSWTCPQNSSFEGFFLY